VIASGLAGSVNDVITDSIQSQAQLSNDVHAQLGRKSVNTF
jgi:hypothetical protein